MVILIITFYYVLLRQLLFNILNLSIMYYSNPFDLSYLDKYDRHLLLELPSQSLYCEYRSLACCYLAFLRRLSDFADCKTHTFMVGRFVSKFSDYGFEVGFGDSVIVYLESHTWINRNTVLSLFEPLGLFRFMSSVAYVVSRHLADERSYDYAYNILLERDLTFGKGLENNNYIL